MTTFKRSSFYTAVALLTLLVLVPVGGGEGLPDVGVILIVEVRDTAGWIALHDQVLRTASQTTRPLGVNVARSGAKRSITVNDPRFTVSVMKGIRSFTVTVTGKVMGGEAVSGLSAFEHAVVESQGIAESEIELFYGLSSVAAQVIEMHITRQ